MPSVLITAFEPYDSWPENASWLALVELTKELPEDLEITTRLYPVDFAKVKTRLADDLAAGYDFALHLGQSPDAGGLRLEAVGINVGGHSRQLPEEFLPLAEAGPAAYQSELPLGDWALRLREAGIPAQVSYHAGTFLCNATLYLSHHYAREQGLDTRSAFIHIPLATTQVLGQRNVQASLPSETVATGLRMMLGELGNGAV